VTKSAPKNIPASIREKLRNVARERNADFGLPRAVGNSAIRI
jgi:hypothetical protein